MNIIEEWIRRLESGEYTQIRGNFGTAHHRCAIGVLKSIYEDLPASEYPALFSKVALAKGLNIVALNDMERKTFKEIALILRKRFDLVK